MYLLSTDNRKSSRSYASCSVSLAGYSFLETNHPMLIPCRLNNVELVRKSVIFQANLVLISG